MDLWGSPKAASKFAQIEMDDKKIELLTVDGTMHIVRLCLIGCPISLFSSQG